MAKRRAQRTEPTTGEPERVTIVVCRGGDCGSRRKHPGVDHAGVVLNTKVANDAFSWVKKRF